MTSLDMHIDFRVKFRVNSNKNKSFLPQEIDWILNDQMDKFIDIRTSPQGNYKNEGFEGTQSRLDDIYTVLKRVTTSQTISSTDNITKISLNTFTRGKYVNLPADYRKLVLDSSDTYTDCTNNYNVQNRLTSSEIIDIVLKDGFHRSHPESPVSELMPGILKVYEDNFTISNIHLVYIYKYPRIELNVTNCVLPDDACRQIVDMAVAKVNAILDSGNYEKYLNEIMKNE